MKNFALSLVLALSCTAFAQNVAPFMGLGNVQFFDNNGNLLTSGVLYTYQAGTTTYAVTYNSSSGTVANTDPITFTTGARASIWLVPSAYYKFVLCAQNDGASCAAADVVFSVDQVPGGAVGGSGGGSSPFTGTFISGSSTPATGGILRLAAGDLICWRNIANSTNLCFRKDTSDMLSWDGGSFKLPEVAPPAGFIGYDVIWADSTAHRFLMNGNNGITAQVVGSGVDINASDQVTQLHFGSSAAPLCATLPNTGQPLAWNGTAICGGSSQEVTWSSFVSTATTNGISQPVSSTLLTLPHTLIRLYASAVAAGVGCSASPEVQIEDQTSSTTLATVFFSPTGQYYYDSGVLNVSMTAGHIFETWFSNGSGCTTYASNVNITAVYQ